MGLSAGVLRGGAVDAGFRIITYTFRNHIVKPNEMEMAGCFMWLFIKCVLFLLCNGRIPYP